jgi:hypothetical protein
MSGASSRARVRDAAIRDRGLEGGGETGEDVVVIAVVGVVGIGNRRCPYTRAISPSRENSDDALGLMHTRRAEHEAVQQSEERGVQADAQSQYRYGCKGKARVSQHLSRAVTNVADETDKPREATLVSLGLDGLRDATIPKDRETHSVYGRFTGAPRVVYGHLQMASQFVLEIDIAPPAANRSAETNYPLANA